MNSRYRIIWYLYPSHHDRLFHNKDVSYIQIPKCGSTAIRQAIEKEHNDYTYIFTTKSATQNEVLFTVIRDPLDRWISGCSQYINNNGTAVYDKIKSGQLVFDEHTLPMSDFLKEFTDIKYFAFSNSVIDEINSYYNLQLDSKIVNVTKHQKGVKDLLSDITKTKEFQKNFQNVYKDDIALWKLVQKA